MEQAAALVTEGHGRIRVLQTEVGHPELATPKTQEPVNVRLVVEGEFEGHAQVFLGVTEGTSDPIFIFRHYVDFRPGAMELRCTIPHLPLPRGRFFLWLAIIDHKVRPEENLIAWSPVATFDVYGPGLDDPPEAVVRRAPFHVEYHWEYERLSGGDALGSSGAGVPPRSPGS